MNKFIILDRDGVINQDSMQYIKSIDEFVLLPKSIDAIVRLTKAGYRIGIATNQSGIARGYYTETTLHAMHQHLCQLVEAAGGRIDAIEYCPHMPDAECLCRKPKPGMLIALAKRLQSSLEGIPYLGDRISDIQAALAVGAQPMMILSTMTDTASLVDYPNVPIFHSLFECVESLLSNSHA